MQNPTHAFNVPNVYQAEIEEIARREKLAELMAQQPQQEYSYKGIQFTSPLQGLAKALQMWGLSQASDRAAESRKAVGERYQSDLMSTIERAADLERGTPAIPERAIPEQRFTPQGADFDDNPYLPMVADQAVSPAQTIPGAAARPGDSDAAARAMLGHPALLAEGLKRLEQGRQDREFRGLVGSIIPSASQPASQPAPQGGDMSRFAAAISAGESGGDYAALGPETGKGRAVGKYQVMPFNIGPWTKEVLGQEMTADQFRASPQAQEAVFNAKFGQLVQKYGNPQDAASVWFSGRPMAGNQSQDILGTTVPGYIDRFNANLALQSGQAPQQPGQPQQQAALPPSMTREQAERALQVLAMSRDPRARNMMDAIKAAMPGEASFGAPRHMQLPNGDIAEIRDDARGGAPQITILPRGQAPYRAPTEETWGTPFTASDAQGNPILVQTSPQGNVRRAPGLEPERKYTDVQNQANAFGIRIRDGAARLESLGEGPGVVARGAADIPVVGNYMVSTNTQIFKQTERDIINAVLRRESGALISPDEFAVARKQYIPQPGDSPETISVKRNNLRLQLQGMADASGRSPSVFGLSGERGTSGPPQPSTTSSAPNTPSSANQIAAPKSEAEFNALPPGTVFYHRDGSVRVK